MATVLVRSLEHSSQETMANSHKKVTTVENVTIVITWTVVILVPMITIATNVTTETTES